jgi:hypothetical protein
MLLGHGITNVTTSSCSWPPSHETPTRVLPFHAREYKAELKNPACCCSNVADPPPGSMRCGSLVTARDVAETGSERVVVKRSTLQSGPSLD